MRTDDNGAEAARGDDSVRFTAHASLDLCRDNANPLRDLFVSELGTVTTCFMVE